MNDGILKLSLIISANQKHFNIFLTNQKHFRYLRSKRRLGLAKKLMPFGQGAKANDDDLYEGFNYSIDLAPPSTAAQYSGAMTPGSSYRG